MTLASWTIFVFAVLLAWALFCRWLLDNPREDLPTGVLFRGMQVYARVFHGLEVLGREHLPTARTPGALIIVANHTAGIDPLLVQSACRFEVRWMMAVDMMIPRLRWFWDWTEVIPVDRYGKDTASARAAIKYLKQGGVLGVFPEGRLERPARHLLPFLPGVGLIVERTGAPVLPVLIEGTPQVTPAWRSLRVRSRSRITFMPVIDYSTTPLGAKEIVADLRSRFEASTGWPATSPPPLASGA
jgi:1-acyl-sn-glycerol-3-phosphate acyltransferase